MEPDHSCLHCGRKYICTPGEPCLTFCATDCETAQRLEEQEDWEDYQKDGYWEE